MKREYEFTLKFALSGEHELEALENQLFDAGCDDALLGGGKPGQFALLFNREAGTARQAVVSAIKDVKKALPEAKLIEVSPDFVSTTEIAQVLNISRQGVRKLFNGSSSTPLPVHDGNPSLWRMRLVLEWLKEQGRENIQPELVEVAKVAMEMNIAKEAKALSSSKLERYANLF